MFENGPFLKLPLRFDVDALQAEVAALPDRAWWPHPGKLPGNTAAMLVTTGGELNEDLAGPMAPTEFLRASPYTMQVMGAIGAVWGRSRLMRLQPGAPVPPHVDTNFYWRRHIRLHVPIVTNPAVRFTCRDETIHMAAGDCWVFDTFSMHQVTNQSPHSRVHLVMDTVGGEPLWDLMQAAAGNVPARFVPPNRAAPPAPVFEGRSDDGIMSPWELRHHVRFIAEQARPDPRLPVVLARLDRFVAGWGGVWAQFGADPAGAPGYARVIAELEADLPRLGGDRLLLRNHLTVYRQIAELVFVLKAPLATAMIPPAAAAPEPVRRYAS